MDPDENKLGADLLSDPKARVLRRNRVMELRRNRVMELRRCFIL